MSASVAAAPAVAAQPGRAWWPIALYPAAFPLSFVLLKWGEAEINVLELIRPALVAVAMSLVITLVLSILAGDRRLGGIAGSAALVALVVDRPEASALLLVVAAFVVLLAHAPHAREIRYLSLATKALQLIATIALIATTISVAGRPGFTSNLQEALIAPPGPADRPTPPAGSPDIFVYLLDGYPGKAAAAQAPWFDADMFPAALRQRGFDVHDDARSNYLLTRLVLPTMFESKHVVDMPELAPPFGPDQAVDARRLRERLERSSGLAAIRAAGYDVMWVSSGWSHLDIRNVDRRIEAPGPSELEVAMLRQSGAGALLQAVDPSGFSQVMRDRAHAAFDAAASLASEPHDRPRFVFVHVPLPHPPTVFRADGSAEDGSPDAAWDTYHGTPESTEVRRRRVFEQVEAIGKLALEGIDRILDGATTDPVVAVFSDHGTDVGFDADASLESDLHERTSSILAMLTPGRPGLADEVKTPINLISALTNAYLGTHVPPQPDTTYAYRGSVLDAVAVDLLDQDGSP